MQIEHETMDQCRHPNCIYRSRAIAQNMMTVVFINVNKSKSARMLLAESG